MTNSLTLVSHHLCPYVQRAAISLTEKGARFERQYIDLGDKPAWFTEISPLGKVPVLIVVAENKETALFESAAIVEYLEDTQPPALHPADSLIRAEHRAWIEFGSQVLNDIAGFYNAQDEAAFHRKTETLTDRFKILERRAVGKPYFDGAKFSLVDATFGPVFRYFDVFDAISDFGILSPDTAVAAWRAALAGRPSVQRAVTADYTSQLWEFLANRKAYLSTLMT